MCIQYLFIFFLTPLPSLPKMIHCFFGLTCIIITHNLTKFIKFFFGIYMPQ